MTGPIADREIKACCATFYQSDLVRMLLGNVFHPGGLALTRRLGEAIGLGPGDRVLDVACGCGASAVHLAQHFGRHVTGLDYGADNIAAAEALAADCGVSRLTAFRQGDAERLPFDDGVFDAVISECSFCTFPDKAGAAAEMARVLRRPEPACPEVPLETSASSAEPRVEEQVRGTEERLGGWLGLTDMTVSGPLPEDVQSLLAWVACVAGAGTPQEYVATLQAAGLADFAVEDRRDALLDMVNGVRRKLLGVELAVGLGKLRGSTEFEAQAAGHGLAAILGDLDLNEGKRLARRAMGLIEDGTVGYTLITARKVT